MLRNHRVLARSFLALTRRLIVPAFLVAASVVPGWAARGVASGTEMQGFGRIVFSLDKEVGAKLRLINSVLILEFDEPVAVDLDKLSQQLPNYVSIARADPDGKSLRLALSDRFKADLKPAGEKLYLDIMSTRWQGLPPPLPTEVVQELVRRARAAEDQLRRVQREAERTTMRELELRVGSAPRFRRAVFQMPRTAPVTLLEKNGEISLVFEANFRVSQPMLRSKLAGLVRDLDVEETSDTLKIHLQPMDGLVVKGFREDDSYTLDFARADGGLVEQASEMPADPTKKAPEPQKKTESAPRPQGAVAAPVAQLPQPAAPTTPAASAASRPEAPKSVMISNLSAIEPAIMARIEDGHDPEGFSLRLANLGDAPVAVVQRGKTLLVMVEAIEPINLPGIPADMATRIEAMNVQRLKSASLLRLSPTFDGRFWLAKDGRDLIVQRGRSDGLPGFAGAAIETRRAFDPNGRESLEALVGKNGQLHLIDDPVSGQKLAMVPVPRAERASPKHQVFSEFSIEPTLAGFAVLPLDEAITFRRQPESLIIGHEIQLNLSALPQEQPEAADSARSRRPLMLDLENWAEDTRGAIRNKERQFLRAAAEAPRATRGEARIRLARFYVANGLYPEAASVLDVLAADDMPTASTKQALILRAFSAAMMERLVDAGRFLNEPVFALEGEQKLLQAIVDARALRYPQALANFRQSTTELDRYPENLQAMFRRLAIESAIEAGDAVFAREQLLAFEKLDPVHRDPHVQQLLAGKLAQMQGRHADAFAAFSLAGQSRNRGIEAEARLGRAIAGLAETRMAPEDARAEFETLSTIWRRSEVELKALEKLGEFYTKEGRWREAFLSSQRATQIMPEHPVTRRMEEAMGRRFESLFLDKEGDKLSKVEALALYQEFRSLIPIGRRGDEIARRLADRLSDLDLVQEAAEILEHQVKHRLEGVARAMVATRLAVLQLQNRQPSQALSTLRATRLASMPDELRRARMLIEARSLGDLFRTDMAIEILANDSGEDVDRLRADIFWKGKRWREAGESYERVLADAWQSDQPLSEGQRMDAMRAGLAYVLGEERLSLDRLRSRYLTKMAKTDDAGAFSLITNDKITRPQAFRDAARSVVNADTMTDFMAAYRKRYPETGGQARPVRSAGENRQSAVERRDQPLPGNG